MHNRKLALTDIFGLLPLGPVLSSTRKSIFGKGLIKPTRVGFTSLKIMKPWISFPIWLGFRRPDRKVPIYNLFNHAPTPHTSAYSTRVTHARDWQNRQHTYDGHLGTDFAIPVGTRICTCAPGRVMTILRQFNHGGLKVYVDHGQGLISVYEHLAKVLVRPGDWLVRGQEIALSGASGLDLFMFFPFVSPHLHLNILLNGHAVDPFAEGSNVSLWNNGNLPLPHNGKQPEPHNGKQPEPHNGTSTHAPGTSPHTPKTSTTHWEPELIRAAIHTCLDGTEKHHLLSLKDPVHQAAKLINHRLYYKHIFSSLPPLYPEVHPRIPLLDLPFHKDDYRGIHLKT